MSTKNFKFIGIGFNRTPKAIEEIILSDMYGKTDIYTTYCRYTAAYVNHFEQHKSCKEYSGQEWADFIPIDLDDKKNIETAKTDAIKIVEFLVSEYGVDPNNLEIFFSGNKGFHINLSSKFFEYEPCSNIHLKYKDFASWLIEKTKITTLDMQIYKKNQILRVPNTVNSKSGLLKVKISFEQLKMSMEEIRKLADPLTNTGYVPSVQPSAALLKQVWEDLNKQKNDNLPVSVNTENKIIKNSEIKEFSMTKGTINKNFKICYQRIMNSKISEGSRNEIALRLNAYLKKEFGLSEEYRRNILIEWNNKNVSPSLPVSEIEKIISNQKVYDYGCKDDILKTFCSVECKYSNREAAVSEIHDTKTSLKEYYKNVLANQGERKLTTGYPVLDECLPAMLPGEVMIIMGRCGSGKSMLLQNILINMNDAQKNSVFLSYEMCESLCLERALQIKHGSDVDCIKSSVAENINNEEFINQQHESLKHCFICDRNIKLSDIKKKVRDFENLHSIKVNVVAIDYLGIVPTHKGVSGTEYSKITEVALSLKGLAKDLDAMIIALSQINRSGDIAEPVTMDMARGSGAIEESADYILGIWRPNLNNSKFEGLPDFIQVDVLKNRKGRSMVAPQKLYFQDGNIKLVHYNEDEDIQDQNENELKENPFRIVGKIK